MNLIYNLPLHPVTFIIIIIEATLLATQVLTFLSRPQEKKRLWQIILLIAVVLRNIIEGMFNNPNPNLPIPISLQTFLGQFFGYIIAAYFPLYFYKTLDFKSLKFHGKYGFLFVMLPAIFIYWVLTPFSHNIRYLHLYIYIIPFIYALVAFIAIGKGIYKQYEIDRNKADLKEKLVIFCAILPYIGVPFIDIFGHQPQWVIEVQGKRIKNS